MRELVLRSCDCAFVFQCCDDETSALLTSAFGGLLAPSTGRPIPETRRYRIDRGSDRRFHIVDESDRAEVSFDDAGSFLFHVDKALTIALQHERPDLYFLHAAAVAFDDRVAILSAPAGTGKSTLTLALLQQGLGYLSDELAPIDLQALTVHPYPHALCLKSPPPAPYEVPPGTLDTGWRLHVPVAALSASTHRDPLPVAAFIFIGRGSPGRAYQRVTAASAAARLMANALNPLAHDGDGLDVAATLSEQVPSFGLDTTNLEDACAAVQEILGGSHGHLGARARLTTGLPV